MKYYNTTIYFINEKNNPYKKTESKIYVNKKITVDCGINRGVIRFYIKQKNDDIYKYTKIRIAKINKSDCFKHFKDVLYHNNDAIIKLENNINIAVNKGQSDAILALAATGNLEPFNIEKMKDMVNKVNNIIFNSKNALVNIQVDKSEEILSYTPDESSIKTAHTIAKTIRSIKDFNHLFILLIPNNEPVVLTEHNKNIERPAIPIDSNIVIMSRNIINNKFDDLSSNKGKFVIKTISECLSILMINDNKISNITSLNNKPITNISISHKTALKRLEEQIKNITNSSEQSLMDGGVDLWNEENHNVVHRNRYTYQTGTIIRDQNNVATPIKGGTTEMQNISSQSLKGGTTEMQNISSQSLKGGTTEMQNISSQSLKGGTTEMQNISSQSLKGGTTEMQSITLQSLKGGLPNSRGYPDIDV